MDLNTIILGAFNFVLGLFSVVLWSNYQDVKKKAETSSKELSDLRTHIAEKYATKDEVKSIVTEIHASFEKYGNRIDASIDRIISKLDSKQDK